MALGDGQSAEYHTSAAEPTAWIDLPEHMDCLRLTPRESRTAYVVSIQVIAMADVQPPAADDFKAVV